VGNLQDDFLFSMLSLLRKVRFVDFQSLFAPTFYIQRSTLNLRYTIEFQQIKSPPSGMY